MLLCVWTLVWTLFIAAHHASDAVSFKELRATANVSRQSPIIYGCEMNSSQLCLWSYERRNYEYGGHDMQGFPGIDGYMYINVIIKDDPKFENKEAALGIFNYTTVENGSLLYCSSEPPNCLTNNTLGVIELALPLETDEMGNAATASQVDEMNNDVVQAIEESRNYLFCTTFFSSIATVVVLSLIMAIYQVLIVKKYLCNAGPKETQRPKEAQRPRGSQIAPALNTNSMPITNQQSQNVTGLVLETMNPAYYEDKQTQTMNSSNGNEQTQTVNP